ncbi:MAG: sulfotransferase [Sporichthyaceae bacterium]
MKRILVPLTTPRARRGLIVGRDRLASAVAAARASGPGPRLRPSFLIAGAQKAGTTYLYQELARHPQVRPALTKEIHYFSDGYRRGGDWYSGFFPRVKAGAAGDAMVTGEATPGYLFHPWFSERLARDLPDARVIVLLRDPVRRAFSHYLHERRLGYEPVDTFEAALDLEDERTEADHQRSFIDGAFVSSALQHHSYRRRGQYLEQLQRLHEHVPPDRVLVLVSEEMYADPSSSYRTVCAFLGLREWMPPMFGANDMAASHLPIDRDCQHRLDEFFGPRKQELAAYLGRPLPW